LPSGETSSSFGDTTSTVSRRSNEAVFAGVAGTVCSDDAVEALEVGRDAYDFDASAIGETDLLFRGTNLLVFVSESQSERVCFRDIASEGEREETEDIESLCRCWFWGAVASAQSSPPSPDGGVTLDFPLLREVIRDDEFRRRGRGPALGVVDGGGGVFCVLVRDIRDDCRFRVLSSKLPLDFPLSGNLSLRDASVGESMKGTASAGMKLSRGLRKKLGRGGGL
jgi:hypothetical protein